MYRTIRRALAVAGTAGVLAVTGAGAAHATTSYLGPVYPGPGQGTFTPSGNIASAGGETWEFGAFDTSQFGQMVWGPWDANAVKLSFDAASDTSYSQPGEVLAFDSTDSDLATGKLVFTGHADMSVWDGGGYTPESFYTRFTMQVTDLSNTPLSLNDPTSIGLDGGIGGQLSVNDNSGGYKANMLFEASSNGTSWTPAEDLFNSIGSSQGTDPSTEIHTSFDAGFYYTPPPDPLTITPQPFDFGSQAVGTQSSPQTFTIKNTSSNSVTLDLADSSAVGDASQFAATGGDCTNGETLNAGDSCQVDFAFGPQSTGAKSATYTIVNGSLAELGTFTLTGTGTATGTATLGASTDGLDFGNVYAGSNSAKQTVTITNTGTADADPLGLVISGPNASLFHLLSTTCGATLGVNDSCTVTVRFRGSGTGDKSATLTASAPGTSVDVSLDGTSVPSADVQTDISETPESPIPSGGQVTWTITVWNTGPSPAKGVTVTDPLPAGTRFFSASSSSGTCKAPHVGAVGTVVCKVGGLKKNGPPATVTITATISAATGSTITNTATASSSTHDPQPANNTASIDTDVS